jgi:hypothetical protein
MYLDNVIEQLKSDIYDAEFEYKHAMEHQHFAQADYCEERANDLRAKLVEVMKNKQQINGFEFITQNMMIFEEGPDVLNLVVFLEDSVQVVIHSANKNKEPEKYKKLLELKEVL